MRLAEKSLARHTEGMSAFVRSLLVTLTLFASAVCPVAVFADSVEGMDMSMQVEGDVAVSSPTMDCCLGPLDGSHTAEGAQVAVPRFDGESGDVPMAITGAFPHEVDTVPFCVTCSASPPADFERRSMMKRE